jgi:hypothetical protein
MGGERFPRERTFLGLTLTPPDGQHYSLNQNKVDKLLEECFIRLKCKSCGSVYYKAETQENLERFMRKKENRFKFYDIYAGKMYFGVKTLKNCSECSKDIFSVEYLGSDEEAVSNVWTDISSYSQTTGYPTENSEELLTRLLETYCKEDNLILDCFIGSGTTAAVAQKLGRRWIGCDINKGAIQTTSKRLQTIIQEQIEKAKKKSQQGALKLKDTSTSSVSGQGGVTNPAQYAFSIYRVNDYDLQIQHNEAVNIACEHIGVTRTKSDSFFDGTRGKSLIKIAPFNHPLSPVDLEEIKKELKARPSEDRDVLVVCLGKELAVDIWLADWNRLRSRGDVPNKIDIIELRTDQKYGKFIKHEPAKARVKMQRKGEKIEIEIADFISPTIIERLSQQNGLLQPKIEDWRSMVDCVMIDPNYDGKIFNISLSDVPEKKNDLVSGKYEFPAPSGKVKIAVKIVDMLGEEVIEVIEV